MEAPFWDKRLANKYHLNYSWHRFIALPRYLQKQCRLDNNEETPGTQTIIMRKCLETGSNQPDAVNPAIAPWFQISSQWRGVTDPHRSAKEHD